MKCTALSTFPALAALGLLIAPAAHAQTLVLQSGDTVTVQGSGTTGTYQGQPISNTTSKYGPGDTEAGSGVTVTVPLGAAFTLDSGGVLNSGGPYGSFQTGLLLQGGTASINGGVVGGGNYYGTGLQLSDGTVTVTGGSISGGTGIYASGGFLQMSGGSLNSAGPFGGQTYGFYIYGTSIVDLFGTFTDASGNPLTVPIVSGNGYIRGMFSNGDTLNQTLYSVGPGSILEFNVGPAPAPEPSAWAALAVGLLGLGALALRRRPA